MQSKPSQIYPISSISNTTPELSTRAQYQYGSLHHHDQQFCYFPDLLPREGISRVTCYLDPPSLLNLGRVSKSLRDHIKDEDTWRTAFGVWYLGLGPESGFLEGPLFRRIHSTWRIEFIKRWDITRRWELCRSSTVLHSPLHAPISSMHLLSHTGSPTLLSSSLSLGIVSRSLPLTGKVIRGFLDASGTGNGLGLGNPNAEFSPNVSCCDVTNDGGTVKIAWGWRTGEVCILTAPRAMDSGPLKAAATVIRSKVDQDHAGTVNTVAFGDDKGNIVVSGANDGFVKLWDVREKKVRCLWTSSWRPESGAPDPIWKIATQSGNIVAVTKSGWIGVWSDFPGMDSKRNDEPDESPYKAVKVTWAPSPIQLQVSEGPKIIALNIIPSSQSPTFLVAYEDQPFFFLFNSTSKGYTSTPFGDSSSGAGVRSLSAYFTMTSGQTNLIFTGDSLGFVSVYDLTAEAQTGAVLPLRKVEVPSHTAQNAVTSLAWNGMVLVTGSSNGSLHVFDGLTFLHLRRLSYNIPTASRRHHRDPLLAQQARQVNQVLLSRNYDTMVASVDDRVIAFKTIPVPLRGTHGGVRGRPSGPLKKRDRNAAHTKYQERLDLQETIASERELLDVEEKYKQMILGKEREQREGMNLIGLEDENEALAYALMLSMDDTSQSEARLAPTSEVDWATGFDDSDLSSIVPSGSSSQIPASPSIRSVSTGDEDFPSISPIASSPLSTSSSYSSKPWGKKASWGPANKPNEGMKVQVKEVQKKTREEIEEEELRLAIELSLKET